MVDGWCSAPCDRLEWVTTRGWSSAALQHPAPGRAGRRQEDEARVRGAHNLDATHAGGHPPRLCLASSSVRFRNPVVQSGGSPPGGRHAASRLFACCVAFGWLTRSCRRGLTRGGRAGLLFHLRSRKAPRTPPEKVSAGGVFVVDLAGFCIAALGKVGCGTPAPFPGLVDGLLAPADIRTDVHTKARQTFAIS
jgi:hypothetical protein